MRNSLIAAIGLAAATPAAAQYAPYPPAPYLPYAPLPTDARVSSGLRIEGQVGYDRLTPRLDDADLDLDGDDGVTYGAEVGYDFSLGSRLLLGAYAGIEGSSIDECTAVGTGSLCIKPLHTFTAGGRLGVQVSPRVLLYAKGGYSGTRLRGTLRVPGVADVSARDDFDGWHVGGGAEAGLSARTYAKLEYVYTRVNPGEDQDTTSFDRHQVKAGVGVRF